MFMGFPGGSDSKEICLLMQETQVRSLGQIPGSGRPLGKFWATNHCFDCGVHTSNGFQHNFKVLGKAMAPHSSTLAWKIPWTEEPGRLQWMGSLRVGHD